MPFPQQTPRPYSRANISSLNDNVRGVYGIFKQGQWIYVGSSIDIKRRMLEHVGGDNPCIVRNAPTSWVYEVTANEAAREVQLTLECKPTCNKRVG